MRKTISFSRIKKQQGFSLVELLITMALGILLLTGLINFYIGNKKTYRLTQEIARLQENGRVAIEILNRDIRMTGYVGCGRLTDIALNAKDFNVANSLVGWQGGNSSAAMLLPVPISNLKTNTSALLVQLADANSMTVKSMTENKIYFSGQHDFMADDLLLISDCQHGDIFRFNNQNFNKLYQAGAQVSRWQKIIYYIAQTDRNNKISKPIYALYRRDLNNAVAAHAELIDGVEDMQISYGEVMLNGGAINYVDAVQVKDWQAVRSIKIDLLLVSKDAVNDAPQTYVFRGKQYQATDRRLYQAWQTVVTLRERNQ